MSDEELIARLRKADEYEPLGHDGWEAADRIEALTKERDEAVHLARMRKTFTEEARDERDAAAAKLAKAVEALEDIKRYSSCGDTRRKAIETLAEIKGESRD